MTDALLRSDDPAATVTVDERLVGTPLYLAPEALAGSMPQPSFDLWGLALVLYEAVAGHHPFAAQDVGTVLAAAERAGVPDIRDYRPDVSPSAWRLSCATHCPPNITRRPESAGSMRNELHRLRASGQAHAH